MRRRALTTRRLPAGRPDGRHAGITRIEVLVIGVILLFALGFLFPLILRQRSESRMRLCEKRQVDIYFAIRRHEASYGHFPSYRVLIAAPRSADRPSTSSTEPGDGALPTPETGYVSWAYPLLPFLGLPYDRNDTVYDPVSDKREGPWADIPDQLAPGSSQQESQYVPALVCPDNSPPGLGQGLQPAWLSYVVNVGLPDLPLADRQGPRQPGDWPANGVFIDRHDPGLISLAPVTHKSLDAGDGLDNTILLSENLDSGDWTDQEESRIGFHWVASHAGSPASWGKPLLGINQLSGQGQGSGELQFARPSSRHPGGVVVVYASGRSTLLEEQIDYRVYCYLMTSDDSQLKRPGFDEPLSWPGDRLEKAP